MSAVLKLVQGTAEWHQHRSRFRNASETPAVMGLSPWVSPYMLWEFKTGRRKPVTTYVMWRGIELEPRAREAYEVSTGFVMEPAVMVEGDYSASLDGITFDETRILEVKCPAKGREGQTWIEAASGKVPDHYYWQIQTQLMVSGASVCDFWVFEGSEGVLVEVLPVPEDMNKLRGAWDGFMNFVTSDTPPPIGPLDTITRTDNEWRSVAERYIEAKRLVEENTLIADNAKSELLGLTTHSSEQGFGVLVTRYWKNGKAESRVTITRG